MALPVSPNSISFNNVNQELGRQSPYNQTVALNDGVVRTLFERTTAGSSIAMSDGRGKSNISAPAIVGTAGTWDAYESGSGSGYYNGSTNPGNRTLYGYKNFYMANYSVNGGGGSIGFTVTGGNLTYEWQYISQFGFDDIYGTYCPNPRAYNDASFVMAGDAGYNDSFSGGGTGTITFTGVYGYFSRNNLNVTHYRGVDGYWRLKASNSAGTIYSPWTRVTKYWDTYDYECNCTCPCGNIDYTCICNCDENNENCTGCCGYYCTCTSCETCTGYYNTSYGNYNNFCV